MEYRELYFDAWINTKRLVFVATHHPGMISIYSLNDDFEDANGGDVTLESVTYNGGTGDKWKYLWKAHAMVDAEIESIE